MADLTPYVGQVKRLGAELDKRCTRYRLLDRYYEGSPPTPSAITEAGLKRAWKRLMPLAEAPWGALVVDSVLDRLEVSGIRAEDGSKDRSAEDAVWRSWQDNQMDAGSQLAHSSTLISGRAFALIWPDEDGNPEISLDSSEQMIVQYREGSQRKRVAALRRWEDEDGRKYATLYRPDGIYKFQAVAEGSAASEEARKAGWEQRIVQNADGEEPWPLKNPFGVVPVVEITVNRRLKPGSFGHARGEYEHALGLLDRLHTLVFFGLVVAWWLGFPLRGVIGDKINRDDDDEPEAPFDADPGNIFQIENPAAQLAEYKAADRNNLSIFPELAQLAAITKTPRHYFPLEQAMSNLSADAIRADEGALNAKVVDHKGSLGEGWEEVMRVCGLMLDQPVELSPRAELVWADHESRSLAERADAATKLKDILPWQALAESVLGATQGQIDRWSSLRSSDGFGQLLGTATGPTVSPGGVILPPGAGVPPAGP